MSSNTAPGLTLVLSKKEAADALRVSEDYFDKHIRPEIKVIRGPGRRVLFPHRELERWIDRHASLALDR